MGCKWSLAVLACVRSGTRRPGAIRRSIDGLTTKVLNERLAKMVRYGVLAKTDYGEKPLRVEYDLTPFGRKFVGILDRIDELERELTS